MKMKMRAGVRKGLAREGEEGRKEAERIKQARTNQSIEEEEEEERERQTDRWTARQNE